MNNDGTRPADDPQLVLDRADTVEIEVREHVGGENLLGQAPGGAAAGARQHEPPLPYCQRLLAENLQAGDVTARQPVGMIADGRLLLRRQEAHAVGISDEAVEYVLLLVAGAD